MDCSNVSVTGSALTGPLHARIVCGVPVTAVPFTRTGSPSSNVPLVRRPVPAGSLTASAVSPAVDVTVAVPAAAVRFDSVNFFAPPGSAAIASFAPLAASVAVAAGASVAASVAAGVAAGLLSSLPHPARASAAVAASTTNLLIAGDTRAAARGSAR
jgi:hypothetical protein